MDKTKINHNGVEKTTETKPVSFRLPTGVFETLHDRGQNMELSAHEMASKIVQENYQAPVSAVVALKEPVTCSKEVILPPAKKHIFQFTLHDIKRICEAFSNRNNPPSYVYTMRVGEELYGVTRLSENLWEVDMGICKAEL